MGRGIIDISSWNVKFVVRTKGRVGESVLHTRNTLHLKKLIIHCFTGTRLGQNTVARICSVKQLSCQQVSEIALKNNGYKVDTCSRCSSNLCNSSDNLKIGIWSFAITAVVALAMVI